MGETKPEENIPSLYFYPSFQLEIKCPSCGFEASVALKEGLNRQMRVGCRKCNNKFLIKPNIRKSYRKPLEADGYLSRLDMTRKTALKIAIKINDISADGIGADIQTARLKKHNIILGETFFIAFHLPKREKEIQAKGKLVSIFESDSPNISHLGIEFDVLESHVEQKIRFYMM
ncbi:hypothetical protein MNBD_NITROSPINAE04-2390 [hydrothermal vent metagenome]|uniref:PilZ domain-containing protein n=1 Tax=hydrothermal vent metagenome TaxID=652676 RepID=A0A3B1CE03_9ZZZZ